VAAVLAAAWGGAAPAGAVDRPKATESTTAWAPGVPAARAYARRRAGVVTFAIRAPRRATGFRSLRRSRSASVAKAMLMAAYLNRGEVRGRALTPGERALLGPMIRFSDNVAANRISQQVGVDGLARLARAAKMRAFTASRVWGGSQINAADQARFFERIDARIGPRHRAYGMRLLRSVVSSQRWGIARARPRGWTLYLKGGWYPGPSALDHQVALLRRGTRRVSLAILISGSPSSAYANETLRGVALRLLRGINDHPKAKVVLPEPRPKPKPEPAGVARWLDLGVLL
jgi:hypothetical protein